jgi:hypothetical protein
VLVSGDSVPIGAPQLQQSRRGWAVFTKGSAAEEKEAGAAVVNEWRATEIKDVM